MTGSVSRRRFFSLAGSGAVVGLAATTTSCGSKALEVKEAASYPFHGTHQAGIVTPAQDRLHFAAFDVTATTREQLVELLKKWTQAAELMTQGKPAGPYGALDGPYERAPDDTGEALDLPASKLTITFGFGPTLFKTAEGADRFGLADRLPKELVRLPHFPADKLDPNRSDGDLCVQACADDPQIAVHAIRNLARIAFGSATVRWSQLGFGRTSSTSTSQATPRNLFGFKDGTNNVKAETKAVVDEQVWVGDNDDTNSRWMTSGTYLVARRIKMHIEVWDRTSLREQEEIVGRDKGQGAPLSGGSEFTAVDFELKGKAGQPLVADNAHIRIASPIHNGGATMLRRGYNFTDGSDGLGRLDAGLFFLAFVRRPSVQYIPVQTRLQTQDGMAEYLQHNGSALFAVPAGVTPGGFIGEQLFS